MVILSEKLGDFEGKVLFFEKMKPLWLVCVIIRM